MIEQERYFATKPSFSDVVGSGGRWCVMDSEDREIVEWFEDDPAHLPIPVSAADKAREYAVALNRWLARKPRPGQPVPHFDAEEIDEVIERILAIEPHPHLVNPSDEAVRRELYDRRWADADHPNYTGRGLLNVLAGENA